MERNYSIFERIRDKQEELRSSEKKVVDYILKNPNDVVQYSITELAKRSDTSETTVNRLCLSLGYSGFGQMKIALMQDVVSEKIKNIPKDISENDSIDVVAEKLSNSLSVAIGNTFNGISFSELSRAIESILKAEKIYFYGIGGSGYLAKIAHHLFLKAGIFNTAYDDGYMQAVSASLLTKRDLAIGISHSGKTKDIIEALRIAKQKGAMTIAISGKKDSKVVNFADIKLFTFSNEEPIYGDFMEARVSKLFIINLLYIGILLKDVPMFTLHLEETAEAIRDRSL